MLGMRSRDRIYLFLAVVGLCCCTKAHSGGWCTGFSLAEASPLHRAARAPWLSRRGAALSAVAQQAGSGRAPWLSRRGAALSAVAQQAGSGSSGPESRLSGCGARA